MVASLEHLSPIATLPWLHRPDRRAPNTVAFGSVQRGFSPLKTGAHATAPSLSASSTAAPLRGPIRPPGGKPVARSAGSATRRTASPERLPARRESQTPTDATADIKRGRAALRLCRARPLAGRDVSPPLIGRPAEC